jgi:class 3 adenylate cyclase/predicted ATPase
LLDTHPDLDDHRVEDGCRTMDVGSWLRSLGLEQYEALFRENDIDTEVLGDLTGADLEKLGMTLGHRKRVLKAIAGLGATEPATKPAIAASLLLSTDAAERRPITVMFCDLVGSTSMAAKLDAEDWRTLVNAYLDEASVAVTGLGGHVLKKLGDGLMALFGYPQAQENDAERAVRAALAIQRALVEINARNASRGAPELQARIGLDSGQVVVDATGEVFGDAPNIAARVQSAADPGSILITATVQRQTAGLFVAEDRGQHELKGLSAPMTLYRIVRASGGGRRGGARALTPLVGRGEELELLARRWDRARKGEGQLALIVGEPGLGKSRLMEEFHGRLGETPHTWVEWSSSQLLQNTPLHPIAEWGRHRFGADLPPEQRLADLENTLDLIGLDPTEYTPLLAPLVDVLLPEARAATLPPEELRRRQLAAMTAWILAAARTQAVVLAFEDLHWADPTSLDLMRALAERGAQAPLLIIATARPEFRPPWSVRSHHSVISLSPLDSVQIAKMVRELSAHHALPRDIIEGVSERTGGVPLFVEEVTRLLLERGEQGGAQAIPPTLQQSLAARLDRLGSARETAQIGAVLGRGFSHALLQSVAGLDQDALQSASERLAEADILFVEGDGAQATYRFKHALIQDAAYDSLLKSRRQALHRRAAEIMCQSASPEPEAVAHHFTQAGLDDLAIEWWGKAGDQALRRSAFQEAISHLGKAIAMADKATIALPGGMAGDAVVGSTRLKVQNDYALAVMWSKGYAAEETKAAFTRVAGLAAKSDDFLERFAAAHGQWTSAMMRSELDSAHELASAFLQEAEEARRITEAGVARRNLAWLNYYRGKFVEARTHCERALSACDPEHEEEARERYGEYTGIVATGCLALTSWQLGEVERARELIETTNQRATELGHFSSMAISLALSSLLEMLRGDAAAALSTAEALEAFAQQHGMTYYRTVAEVLGGWARGRCYDPSAGVAKLRQALAALAEQGHRVATPLYYALLAELEAEALGANVALGRIDEALALARQIDNWYVFPLLHRVRGEILLKRDPADRAFAEEAFRASIAIAKEQGARSHLLLTSLHLAKLYRLTGRHAEAHTVLGPALNGFSPTPELPEIAEAQALLTALAASDEVKADAARLQRLTHLQVAYGNALLQARGYGAPEMTEAFARARESASGDKDAPGRLAADYGLWVGSYVRGELPSMQAHAAAFLSDVGASPESPEAGVAHRAAGMTCWFAGEYREAQDHLERALALFQPGRDDDLAFRFGHDAGASAMFSLAAASWPLGEIDRATSLIDLMQTRIASLTHVGTLAVGRMHTALFELMRGEHARVAPNVFELVRLAREHDLPMQGAFGVFLEGWATAASGAPADGLADMRRGVELLCEQNVLYFDGLLKIALAEAEARAGNFDRAVAILDEALATCDRLGNRTFEAELHRVRGELLLERDPANTAIAEDAFLTAVAVAKEQGTRSFELRAALSLAKMYQSISHSAAALAVLAPALEGFSPAPEMPEIQEAEALLAALAEMEEVNKSAVAQSERRLHVQTAYGHAMMWAKGFAAEETTVAFSRAAALAANVSDFSERFAAAHGQCTVALLRGELETARKLALAMLEEAEDAGHPMEARVARRSRALILYFRGDFLEARNLCEQSLDAGDPKRELEARERFGDDVGAVVLSCLAITSWQLGEVDRSRELIEASKQRATEIEHATSMATPLYLNSLLELLRGDAAAALRAAEAMEALGRDHGMIFFRIEGELLAAVARGQMGDPATEAVKARQALTAYADQGAKLSTRFFEVLLARLEAASEPQNALNCIDEALAQADQAEYRWDLAFAHRLRGDILLKCDPSNAAAAEDAFKIAIAIATGQGARSLGLQAALSLAKLYRLTGRPADARAVLVPALAGFSPTPEMPEIAEAQTLLVAIEADAHVRRE